MFAPILLIGGVGYWQQQRTQKANQPTRIEVRSLKILPPTPSDVARGFDTRVKLSLGYSGAQPRGWGINGFQNFSLVRISQPNASQLTNSGQKVIPVRDVWNRFDNENDVYVGTYLMKSRELPSNAPIVLNGAFQSQEPKQTPQAVTIVGKVEKDLKWRAIVRRKGIEKSEPPLVSHFNGLKLKSIALHDKRKGKSSHNFDIVVICELLPALIDERTAWERITPMQGDVYLANSKGQRFESLTYSPVMRSINDSRETGLSPEKVELSFYSWEDFPQDATDLTFHAKISVDDLWPLEINIPVKEMPTFQ